MILTPEERRALLALAAMLFLGQAVSLWEEHRRSLPDRELASWINRLAAVRADSAAALGSAVLPADLSAAAGLIRGRGGADAVEAEATREASATGSEGAATPRDGAVSRSSATSSQTASKGSGLAATVPPGVLEGGRLRINQASAADLEMLPGIGPALAERILVERTRSGPFRAPRDLLRVSGIGPKKLEALREKIDFASSPPGAAPPDSSP